MKLLLIPILFLNIIVNAQKADSIPVTSSVHGLTVKWSPQHLFGYYPTVQLALEHRIANQVTLQWDGGYILPIDAVEPQDGFDKKGFKAKLDVRYYASSGRNSFFFAPEFFYNYVDFKKSGTFGVDCDDPDGDCDYYRFFTYPVRYREPGLGMKAGFFHQFGRHFCIEYHVGIAQRFIRYSKSGTPPGPSYEDRYEEDHLDFKPVHKSSNKISPTTAFRVGYIFR